MIQIILPDFSKKVYDQSKAGSINHDPNKLMQHRYKDIHTANLGQFLIKIG